VTTVERTPEYGYEYVARRGVFDFSSSMHALDEIIEEYAAAGANEDEVSYTRDLTYLSAAEYALLPLYLEPAESLVPLEHPLLVSHEATMVAALKVDCSTTWVHQRPEAAQLWDVALFAGDMSKIERILQRNPTLDDIEHLVEELESRYLEGMTSVARSIGNSGVVRVQGLVWKAKLALVHDPDRLQHHIDNYLDNIPIVYTDPGREVRSKMQAF
jgi:hypothetical protein